jgi:RNA polymerase sigma factor (sigma-70 family)
MSATPTTPAANQLVRENERLVNYMVSRYLQRYHVGSMEREDLMSWGFVGLVRAAQIWSPERGVAFSTLACKVIERSIIRGVQSEWRPDEAQVTVSLDAPTADDESNSVLGDFVADDASVDVETKLTVREAISRLPQPDQALIRRRYYEGWSLKEVGEALGLSSMGVLARERHILRRLRSVLANGNAGAFVWTD